MKKLVRLATVAVTLMIICVLVMWIGAEGEISTSFDEFRIRWDEEPRADKEESIESALHELVENNEETRTFVDNYPNREAYLGIEIDLSEDVCEGEVPLFLQWDLRWGYESYGDNIIGLAGCGPACLSMAYVYLTGDLEGNPREMAKFGEENGYHTKVGTEWSLWTEGAEKLGISGTELALDEYCIQAALDEGGVVICSMRPGDFTRTGHYILIKGYDEKGFMVHDPNSLANTQKQWLYEDIRGQIKNLWCLSLE